VAYGLYRMIFFLNMHRHSECYFQNPGHMINVCMSFKHIFKFYVYYRIPWNMVRVTMNFSKSIYRNLESYYWVYDFYTHFFQTCKYIIESGYVHFFFHNCNYIIESGYVQMFFSQFYTYYRIWVMEQCFFFQTCMYIIDSGL
jgi:hypothetical protein